MNRKTICLPGYSDLDITPIQELIHSAPFLRLHNKKQLGISYLVFPAAQHSRFEHSLGTYWLTKERSSRLLEEGVISSRMADNINLYGLLHDIGHGPLSHDVEVLCNGSHNEHGLVVLNELRDEIEACGGDFSSVKRLFMRKHPLSCCVSHQWLGTDKMNYLALDASRTSESIGFRMGDLINHVSFRERDLAIDSCFVSEIRTFLECYVSMFDRVYFRKGCIAAKKLLQKLVVAEMKEGNSITPNTLLNMVDYELEAILHYSKVPRVSKLFRGLIFKHLWPKTTVLLTPDDITTCDRLAGKHITNLKVSGCSLKKISRLSTLEFIDSLEQSVARFISLNPMEVIIIPSVNPHRFVFKDVRVYDQGKYVGMFLKLHPGLKASLEETAYTRLCVRVCVMPEHRERVSQLQVAQGIRDLLLEAVAV